MKQTVFITLKGNIDRYVQMIFTKTNTKNKDVQILKTKLNIQIKDFLELPATADNCKELWQNLMEIFKETEITDKKDECYKEIVKAVDDIGKKIAYISKRTGITNRAYSEGYEISYLYDKQREKEPDRTLIYLFLTVKSDSDFLDLTKRMLLYACNNSQFKLEGSKFDQMTEEELVQYGKDFAKKARANHWRTYTDRAKKILKNLEKNIPEWYREQLERDSENATAQECCQIMENADKQLSYIKDRMNILKSGDQSRIDRLHQWDAEDPDSHIVSDDFVELLQRVSEFSFAKKKYFDRACQLASEGNGDIEPLAIDFRLHYVEEENEQI